MIENNESNEFIKVINLNNHNEGKYYNEIVSDDLYDPITLVPSYSEFTLRLYPQDYINEQFTLSYMNYNKKKTTAELKVTIIKDKLNNS